MSPKAVPGKKPKSPSKPGAKPAKISKPGAAAGAKKVTAKAHTKAHKPAAPAARGNGAVRGQIPVFVARATPGFDEDDFLFAGGTVRGTGFGRCGGRALSSRIEQTLCDLLSRNGVIHSHSPRHFEVRFEDQEVAAYAPMIVIRGRGREGKTVVIEAIDQIDDTIQGKIRAFRRQYGMEFYLVYVAPEDVLDELPIDAYDESCTTNDVGTLINRLAD